MAQETTAMSTLDEDDEGKDVVASNSDKVGVVKDVSRGTAHVDPDPGITDEVKSSLGWGDRDEDTFPLDESDVETVTDDEVRLNVAR